MEECAAASQGQLEQVKPQFSERALAVPFGGVLAALPTLLAQGLLRNVSQFLRLPNGYCGLNAILMLLALLTLARVRNVEQLRYLAPGEWGRLLGLDRIPEIKTLRRKLKALGQLTDGIRSWQAQLAKTWMRDHGDACASLAIDGRVKTYSGSKGKLPKHFVSRQKLCLPAAVSYWINALGGLPLLCIHQQIDPKLCQVIEREVVPQLRSLGALPESPPDLTASDAEPVLNLVFDREGWSPKLFKRLAKQGIAVITWHKGSAGPDWPQARFKPAEVPISAPAATYLKTVLLAEKKVSLSNDLKVRQIRRLCDGGHQAVIITTHPNLPIKKIAGAMFSRWSQENFFKTMRNDFNFDALSVHQLAVPDDSEKVINPQWRECEKQVRSLTAKRQRAVAKWNQQAEAGDEAAAAQCQLRIAELAAQLEQAKLQRKQHRRHILVKELADDQKLDALPIGPRLLHDIVRMIAYRAETAMMPAIMQAQGKKPNARKLLSQLFLCEANLMPQPELGLLRTQFLGLGNNSVERALLPLIEELNATRTKFPDTDLTLFYELSPGSESA